ncbi:hypothetical protein GDO78_015222, partial [Eleutherodactylus coqui]
MQDQAHRQCSTHGYLGAFKHFATEAIHAGQEPEQWNSMAVVPPISLSTTFKQHGPGEHAVSLAYASGLAATLNVAHLLKAGDQIICNSDVYAGTNTYFRRIAAEMGLKVAFVDCSNLKCLEAAITSETKLVWIETPTNPTLTVIDIQGCADIVHKHQNIILAIDNTFMSAYFQKYKERGSSNICMYSCKGSPRMNFSALGAIPSPFDCYLCNRGLKTLPLRMRQHFHNALAAAMFLERDPRVDKVLFPGLPSHPQYEITKRQCTGVPGMITFYIKGNVEHAKIFLKSLKVFALAESLGGYESLAEHPAIMTHASVPEEDRALLNISDTLIRLSIGLEDTEDIIEDLNQALQVA